MRFTVISTIHKEEVPAYIADLLEKKYENIQIQHDSVNHYKIRAERELTKDEITSARFEPLLQRDKGRNEGNEKRN